MFNLKEIHMKKTLIAAAMLMAIAGSAMALDVGVTLGSADVDSHQYQGFAGVTVGQKYGSFGVIAGYERTNVSAGQSRYSLTGSYDVLKFGKATVVAKAGAVYLDNNTVTNGWAGQVGAGVVYPLTEKVAATVDYRYQAGQSSVNQFNGNSLSAGLQYSF
jgi:opacity protein-like surface antigen